MDVSIKYNVGFQGKEKNPPTIGNNLNDGKLIKNAISFSEQIEFTNNVQIICIRLI